LVIMLVATLLAAVAGGKVGQRYHRKVDRVGGLQQVT
jgi:outer membrane lipoprotein SlyB